GADVWSNSSDGAGRIPRDLAPGLRQRVDKRVCDAASDDRDLVQLSRDIRHQAFGKVDAVDGRGSEVLGRPRTDAKIERVDLTRRAGAKDEDYVFGGVEKDRVV